jgi:HK97 family phage major capsid protein
MSNEAVTLNKQDLELALAKAQGELMDVMDEHKVVATKMQAEIDEAKTASVETKGEHEALSKQYLELADRCVELEQAGNDEPQAQAESIGEQFTKSDAFKSFIDRGGYGMGRMEIKTAIVNAVPSLTQPLTAGTRLDRVIREPNRALRIRDLLPVGRTDSNIVWFPKEDTFTNAAAVVVGTDSPIIIAENVAKAESALTFTSASAEVKTIAHWIPVSKQALDDSNFLSSYIDSRLMYGLKLKEDTELIVGTGLIGTITGLYTGRTAYSMDSPLSYTTKLDVLRDCKAQAETSNYEVDFVVLNPQDFADIELSKETAGMYIYANPATTVPMTIWGMRVVLSNSMAAGTFLCGSSMGAQIWDRQDANVAVSYEDSDNFQKNMVSVRAEERIALTIYNAGAFRGGLFAVT